MVRDCGLDILINRARGILDKKGQCMPIDTLRDQIKESIVVPLIVDCYDALPTSDPRLQDLFYLARSVTKLTNIPWLVVDEEGCGRFIEGDFYDEVYEIAHAGRRFNLENPRAVEQRIKENRLYLPREGEIVSAQVSDDANGGSASVCINCYEPVAYCDETCEVCSYDLINSAFMPDFQQWKVMSCGEKRLALREAYKSYQRTLERRDERRSSRIEEIAV